MRRNICGAVLLFLAVFVTTETLMAGALDRFNGRWAGWGRLTLDSGKSESVKCVTVYRLSQGGNSARQSFRCTSDSYRFNVSANYKASGSNVTANWSEEIYALDGTIRAKLTRTGFKGTFRSSTFAGGIAISHSGSCRQTIAITPRQIEIRSLTVDVKRC